MHPYIIFKIYIKVENHDTTKLGNQHENLLKGEIQRM
jgi:hypothetical protein